MPQFNVGNLIVWDSKTWRVKNVDEVNNLYELELVDARQFNTLHGNGGYMDVATIDASAKRVGANGGSTRRRKSQRNKRKTYKSLKRRF
jgi:hypothetical protein